MKILCSALLAAALVLAGSPHAMSATPPPNTPMKAICGGAGFMASPATYTQAQMNSALGVKYMCWKAWPGARPPYFRALMKCSSKFSPGGAMMSKGKAIYYCTSSGHIR